MLPWALGAPLGPGALGLRAPCPEVSWALGPGPIPGPKGVRFFVRGMRFRVRVQGKVQFRVRLMIREGLYMYPPLNENAKLP